MNWNSQHACCNARLEELISLLHLGSKEASGTHTKLFREQIDHDSGLNLLGFLCVTSGFESSKGLLVEYCP